MSHVNGKNPCERCEKMLEEGHPSLGVYFRGIHEIFPDAHISCVFRDEAAQNEAVKKRTSKLSWPKSKHNVMKNGKPVSEAMDLFRLGDDKKAYFEKAYYLRIAKHLRDLKAGVVWGGDWNSFPDAPHYELDLRT